MPSDRAQDYHPEQECPACGGRPTYRGRERMRHVFYCHGCGLLFDVMEPGHETLARRTGRLQGTGGQA
jgi:hypothetical protein